MVHMHSEDETKPFIVTRCTKCAKKTLSALVLDHEPTILAGVCLGKPDSATAIFSRFPVRFVHAQYVAGFTPLSIT